MRPPLEIRTQTAIVSRLNPIPNEGNRGNDTCISQTWFFFVFHEDSSIVMQREETKRERHHNIRTTYNRAPPTITTTAFDLTEIPSIEISHFSSKNHDMDKFVAASKQEECDPFATRELVVIWIPIQPH